MQLGEHCYMPVRPGIITYFRTPGLVAVDLPNIGREFDYKTTKVDECHALTAPNRIVVTVAGHGSTTIVVGGYTHVVFWRDRADFLGVELIMGEPNKLDNALQSGESIALEATFTFEPK
ncbi:MAG TPA: hypothetical protein VJG48_00040 [Candidatus Paceibacterota bacterium]